MRTAIKFSITYFALFIVFASVNAQKIGLLMDSYVLERWYIDQKFFTERVKELGGQCLVEVPYGDPKEQVRLGKKLLKDGIDVLVIIPTDSRIAAEIVKAANEVKIPVISYDRLILSKELSFYISFNNFKVGELQAEYAFSKAPRGNYVLLNGPTTDNNAILFRKGQLHVLQPYIDRGDINLLADFVLKDWSEIEALMKMDEFHSSLGGKKIDAIIAANDALANGTLQVLSSNEIGKVVITGQDAELNAVKNIINHKQNMTVYKPIRAIAYTAAEVAIKLARGEEVKNATTLKNGDFEINCILLEPTVVDITNYKDTVVKDGHISLSEITGDQ